MAIRIAIAVLSALVLALLVIYLVNESYASQFEYQNMEKWEKRFYTQNFDPEQKKIFLIGSSHTEKSDTIFIEKSLMEQSYDYEVYNLAYMGSQPATRVSSIDLIIQTKPDLVVYGLEFLSFWPHPLSGSSQSLETVKQNTESLLPEPKELFSNVTQDWESNFIDFENFKNPKLTTLKIIDVIRGEHKFQYQGGKHPFGPYGPDRVMTYEELQKNVEEFPFLHFVDNDSKHIDAMKKMIKKFQENNIPVIIFTTPHHELYLKTISEQDKKNYFLIIDSLVKEFGIKHYDFHDRYSDLETWANGDHIAGISIGSMAYSEDIVEIIIKEINQ